MKARFGRDIRCQKCGRNDRMEVVWNGKFRYHYECKRCNVVLEEVDRGKDRRGGENEC